MMHDCALTEDYFILLDMPLCFEPEVRRLAVAVAVAVVTSNAQRFAAALLCRRAGATAILDHLKCSQMPVTQRIVKEGSLPFTFNKSRKSRFGLMPRYATSEDAIKWCVRAVTGTGCHAPAANVYDVRVGRVSSMLDATTAGSRCQRW
jgi:carotenoid cleavage dioxygenase-like enzyme